MSIRKIKKVQKNPKLINKIRKNNLLIRENLWKNCKDMKKISLYLVVRKGNKT